MKTIIYLLRHGHVDDPVDSTLKVPLIYGEDAGLSEQGRRQMKTLGGEFKKRGIRVSKIFRSPLIRAEKSADNFKSGYNDEKLDVKAVNNLRATKTPQWDGRPVSELDEVVGDFFADNPQNPQIKGESKDESDVRIWTAFQDLIRENEGETLVIITHSDEVRLIRHRLIHPEGPPNLGEKLDQGKALSIYFENGHFVEGTLISPENRPPQPEIL